MGRHPRIEYEGAVYHLMSRGNRREAIFRDDHDGRIFLDTLEEVCERTGWRVHAFVLMGNHYHLLIETPEANLVDGMRWLQGTYTKRFNLRHKEWGHLFQSRYKALVVDEDGDYFPTVSDYIHLNPARVNGFSLNYKTLADHPWSSYPFYLRPSKRPDWLSVHRTLGHLGLLDDRSGRTRYRQRMEERVLEITGHENPADADGRWARIRRGWCFGTDAFRDRMVQCLDGVMEGKRRDSFVGVESARHDELEAKRLLTEGIKKLGLCPSDLEGLKKGDPYKKAMAWLIRKNTSVKNEWIARHLQMGCVSNISHYVRQVENVKEGILSDFKETLNE